MEWFTLLIHFPRFWYMSFPAWWLRFLKRLLLFIDNQFAVRVMLRFWLTPVWQDRTVVGRSLSFLFRTVHIIVGLAAMGVVTLGLSFWLILWLSLPFILFWYRPPLLVLYIGGWVIDGIIQLSAHAYNPVESLIHKSQHNIERFRHLLLDQPQSKYLLWLIEKNTLPPVPTTLMVEKVVAQAHQVQNDFSEKKLAIGHLLIAFLGQLSFHGKEARDAYAWLRDKENWARVRWLWQDEYPIRPTGGINRHLVGIPTPELNKVSTDLTQLAARGEIGETIGRDKEVEELVRIIGPGGKDNVLLVGEPGVGKTTIVEGLTNEIIRGTKHEGLKFRRLVQLDIAALSATSPEKFKERIVTIINELKEAKNVILFVDEIHNLVEHTEGGTDPQVFAAFEPHLDAREFQFIGATTPANYKRFIEPNEAFARTFRVIRIEPATPEETLTIIRKKAFELERKHHVSITYIALKQAVELARRYVQDRYLPDSAIDILEETVNKASLGNRYISSAQVAQIVTERTSIPVRSAESEKEKEILLTLETKLHQRIIGQDEAIKALADSLRRARTGMAEEGKLLASFLFAGATGVGKTETAKALAEIYFGSEGAMIRLDMSEYQTDDSINKLIGAPPGRAGYESGGQLTEAVRHRPFTVVLLDEIEKANPRILDVFLQLLDDARLTDGTGRTVDFSNTMLIATSNVGTKTLVEGTQKNEPFAELRLKVLETLREQFRPEFLNRFTGTIVFQPLSAAQVKDITRLLLKKVAYNLSQKDITLTFDESLVASLASKGYNPLWGVRELKRVIRDEVEEVLAKKMLENKIVSGQNYLVTQAFLQEN